MKTLFFNGHIYVDEGVFTDSMVVENGRILDSSAPSAMEHLDEQVDLHGRTVIPGFHDSHMHLHMVGNTMQSVPLYGATSIREIIHRTRTFIEEHRIPANHIVSGMGWNQDYFSDENRLLNRHDLDQISTTHLIILSRACGHVLAANTAAIEAAGVTSKTEQPEGGQFDVDSQGVPTGVFRENANGLIQRLHPSTSVETIQRSLQLAMDYASSMGITAVQTMDMNVENHPMMLEAYHTLLSQYPHLRVYQQCHASHPQDIEFYAAQGYRTGTGNDFFRIGPIKLFVDGSLGARTALLKQPYHDDPHTKGIQCLTQEQLNAITETANRLDFQSTVHVIGDAAMEMVLDSYARLMTSGKNPLRHAMIHCQITDRPLLQRFADLGVYAQVQPIFLHYDSHIVYDRVGQSLAETSYAFGSMIRDGIPVSFGSDSPVENMNPFHNIYCAVTRRDLQGNGPYVESEGIRISQAIDAYTIGSAQVCFREHELGRLKPGFLADFVVLDQDIFNMDSMHIKEVRPIMTVVNGHVVYQSK